MPRTKTAKKALRQNIRRRAKNIEAANKLKIALKTYKKLIANKKVEEATKQLAAAYKLLDKSTKINIIKKNKASRLKSRLARKLASK